MLTVTDVDGVVQIHVILTQTLDDLLAEAGVREIPIIIRVSRPIVHVHNVLRVEHVLHISINVESRSGE